MKRSWWYRFIFLLIVTAVAVVVTVPTIFNLDKDDKFFYKSKINLGLDLQGGLYLVLGIDFKKVYQDELKTYLKKLSYTYKDESGKNVEIGELDNSDELDPKISVTVESAQGVPAFVENLHKNFAGLLRVTKDEGGVVELALTQSLKTDIEKQAVGKSIEVIRNRIDEFGVSEPEIVSQGNDRIVVALPGVKDIDRAKSLIGQTAKLEFKLVSDKLSPSEIGALLEKVKKANIEFKQGDRFSEYVGKVNDLLKDDLPKGTTMAFSKEISKGNNEVSIGMPYLLEAEAAVTGEDLSDSRVSFKPDDGTPIVNLEFKTRGAEKFDKVTGDNTNRFLAIILDGNVYSAPRIESRISNGHAIITLNGRNYANMLKEAQDLAMVLRAGALPVQLDFLEQRRVGPSLGADSIIKARFASILGSLLVVLFIVFYYRLSGLIAIFTLSLNVLFIIGILVGLEATLTLPGIAGIALTVGMGVDANIIIYERIREELRAGVGNYKSVEAGFEQAFWTIVDANITTALAGICLLMFGTGPVKGFAVTLLIGIVATVYCSYFVGRLLFELYMDKVQGQDLSI